MLHTSAGRRARSMSRFALQALSIATALVAFAPAAPARSEPPAAVAVADSAAPTPSASPTARIDGLHVSLLAVMKDAVALGYDGRAEKLGAVIPTYFDVEYMARKSLGAHWNTADAVAKQRYLETFERFMVANYAGRFNGYSGQSFETLGEEAAPSNTMIVKSRLVDPEDENVELNYRMRKVDGTWKIIDVYLNGTVSELALRRSEFVSIVKRENLDGLLKALDAKIAKLAAGDGEA